MKLKFDTKREEDLFRELLKCFNVNEMRPELMSDGSQLIQKMIDYF